MRQQQDSLCSLPPVRPSHRLFELADMLYKASHLSDKVCGPAVVHLLISSFHWANLYHHDWWGSGGRDVYFSHPSGDGGQIGAKGWIPWGTTRSCKYSLGGNWYCEQSLFWQIKLEEWAQSVFLHHTLKKELVPQSDSNWTTEVHVTAKVQLIYIYLTKASS